MTSPGAPRRFPQALGCTDAATISYRCPATRTAVLRSSFWGSCRYVFKRKLPKVLPGEDRRKFEFDHRGTLRFLMPTALSGSPSECSSVSWTRRKPLATATLPIPDTRLLQMGRLRRKQMANSYARIFLQTGAVSGFSDPYRSSQGCGSRKLRSGC
jgi:hypothetical protein